MYGDFGNLAKIIDDYNQYHWDTGKYEWTVYSGDCICDCDFDVDHVHCIQTE